jgi:hypothetical protein
MSSLVKDDHPMFCMPCTILLMVSTNYPIFGCLHESTQSLFKDGICSITSWLIHEDVHQACLMLLIGPLHSARKTELSRWTHVGFASVMGPPPCGLLFMETFYQIFSPSTTQMICFVLVDYVPIFNLSQNIRARACACACVCVWDERVLHLHRRNIDVPYSERKQLLERR